MLLQPGDLLLYARRGFWARAIQIKTWSRISHVECCVSATDVVASRDGRGVARYALTRDGLDAILRPRAPFDLDAALRWFATVDGQGYDWLGLLAFFWARWQGRDNQRMFCSELATRWYRAGGVEPFTPETDADAVAPGEFLKSGAFRRVWTASTK